jgi:hypothetical protein
MILKPKTACGDEDTSPSDTGLCSDFYVLKWVPTPHCLGHFLIEALVANLPVSVFHRAVVDDLVARCHLATIGATNLLVLSGLG